LKKSSRKLGRVLWWGGEGREPLFWVQVTQPITRGKGFARKKGGKKNQKGWATGGKGGVGGSGRGKESEENPETGHDQRQKKDGGGEGSGNKKKHVEKKKKEDKVRRETKKWKRPSTDKRPWGKEKGNNWGSSFGLGKLVLR